MPYLSAYRSPHPCFPQPEDGSIKVWRYLDLPRLISVLASGQLKLARLDLLQDAYEGSVTRGEYEHWLQNPTNAAYMAEARKELRRDTYVSCWHANDAESEAMWRLYCGPREGVALQTSYEALDRSLPRKAMLGLVTYADYASMDLPAGLPNALAPMMLKRIAFQHEHEVRVMIWRPIFPDGLLHVGPERPPHVVGIDWAVEDVLEHLYVSPYAPEWYRDVVADVLARFAPGLVSRLVWSRMKGVPLY